jgi:hypothetical protein
MGREVRRVAPDWIHPRDSSGRYSPRHEGAYQDACARWHAGYAAFVPQNEGSECRHYWEYAGHPPDEDAYMYDEAPDPATLTHFQMYEETSEGTPISPVFDTIEALARWLADTGASAFGGMTATYEQWLATCGKGWAPSLVLTSNGEMKSGVEL